MQIPSFQVFMLPILQAFKDGKERSLKEIMGFLIRQFNFDESTLKQTIPSGRQTIFYNRAYWAQKYLKEAGLIALCGKNLQITKRGKEVLAQNPPTIDIKFLRQFDEFNAFQRGGRGETHENLKNQSGANSQNLGTTENLDSLEFTQTPEEQMGNAYEKIQNKLVGEILSKINALETKAKFFEKLVVELLVKMGYGGSQRDISEALSKGMAEVTGKSGDGGIDGIIKEDKLGLDVIYIQAKCYERGSVQRGEIQAFAGALDGKGAKKGVFITTSDFSSGARKFSEDIQSSGKKIILIDGKTLAGLMIEHDLGVKLEYKYELKKLDSDYFEEDFE